MIRGAARSAPARPDRPARGLVPDRAVGAGRTRRARLSGRAARSGRPAAPDRRSGHRADRPASRGCWRARSRYRARRGSASGCCGAATPPSPPPRGPASSRCRSTPVRGRRLPAELRRGPRRSAAAGDAAAQRFRPARLRARRARAEIDWHRDFKSGYRWPRPFYLDVRASPTPRDADAKVPWELSRGHQLLALARAARLFGDERYAAELASQWASWLDANPPGAGDQLGQPDGGRAPGRQLGLGAGRGAAGPA